MIVNQSELLPADGFQAGGHAAVFTPGFEANHGFTAASMGIFLLQNVSNAAPEAERSSTLSSSGSENARRVHEPVALSFVLICFFESS